MLARCTNPSCSAPFRHLTKGRLFRLEIDPTLGSSKVREPEYFWLCEHCSTAMTLLLAQDGRVMATGLGEPNRQLAFTSVNRENGLSLRSVSFLRRTSREAEEGPVQESTMPRDWEQRDDTVVAASNCPVPDCNSLVLEYRTAGSIRRGRSEDWRFTCSRCGMELTVTQSELVFQCVPKQWLAA